MTTELEVASKTLEVELDEYLDTYMTILRSSVTSEAKDPFNSIDAIVHKDTTNEYSRIVAFEKRVKQSKAAISASRNNSFAAVPTSVLPIEVLTRIFRLIVQSEPCKMCPRSMHSGRQKFSKYPILFTHVCARWRQIVIGTPLFWSHIDITPELCSNERLWNRTQGFLSRTGHSALDMHIATYYPTDEYWEAGGLNQFLVPLVPRIRSLDFQMRMEYTPQYDAEPSAGEFCSSILSSCFGINRVPGTLTQVSLDVDNRYPFIEAAENVHTDRVNYFVLDVPAGHLEEIWRHVTVLRLEDLFPFWTSAAYSGLIELNLSTNNPFDSEDTFISEHALVNILSSSPQLRTLTFSLLIVPANAPCAAVVLSGLETLILRPKSTTNLEAIVRLLAPGLKPLHVTIYGTPEVQDERYRSTTEIANFFIRSNIAALHFVGAEGHFRLLNLVNSLQTLALTLYYGNDITASLPQGKPLNLHMKTLIILYGHSIEFDDILALAKVYAPERLLLWGSYPIIRGGGPITYVKAELEKELTTQGTSVKIVSSEQPNPAKYSFTSL